MIDWLTIKIPFRHLHLNAGLIVSISADGEPEWETAKRQMVCSCRDEVNEEGVKTRNSLCGSHCSNVAVKSDGSIDNDHAEFLMISGNPSKYLQGHNIFGSDDLCGLTDAMLDQLLPKLGLIYDPFTRQQVRSGHFTVAMVDINYSYELENQQDVMAFIHAAEFKARSRAGRATTRPGTIYFGQHSRRWALKMYSKYNELTRGGKGHKLHPSLLNHETQLLEWTKNILRIELRLLSKELKKLKLTLACDLQRNIQKLFLEYKGKIVMNEQRALVGKKLMELPTKLRSSYALWQAGHHMAEILPRTTYYRHRKELIKFGIDLTISCEKKESNVVPFIRVLEAKPATIPEWAYRDNLIFQPQRRAS